MITKELKNLCMSADLPAEYDGTIEITGISCDSREVKPGYLFVAVRGLKTDGHLFIRKAVEKGAAAVIAEEFIENINAPLVLCENSRRVLSLLAKNFYGDPANSMKLIGVTGTNGKTTTTYFLESLFSEAGESVGVIGTLNYRWPGHEENAVRTTPDAVGLYRYLYEMKKSGVTLAVVEVSSHALEQYRVFGLSFTEAVFTNISHDHLDYHHTIDAYAVAKAKLFSMVDSDGKSIINYDDKFFMAMEAASSADVAGYGKSPEAKYQILSVTPFDRGTRFSLKTPDGIINLTIFVWGMFNVYNAAAAAAAGFEMGLSKENVIKGIASLKRVPGRMEGIRSADGRFRVIIDYAHTPDALQKVLECAREFTDRKLIVVFGCGGDRDREKRPEMGRAAYVFADEVFITTDNPRTEDPDEIINEIIAGVGKKNPQIHVISDREEAIKQAVASAGEGDTVVIAGKGHESYQIIGAKKIPFSDRKIAEKYLMQGHK
ncbi:UDP-N-acetylmuramoyl-L-alanyl-D-glutamate--2,6-diaminopimelate ligase [bacterium]|nr:UDP-N-acetylmuramoyl-L-alanyl-D-glutamate--2,6-diaminopimelate ligase [bacterium]